MESYHGIIKWYIFKSERYGDIMRIEVKDNGDWVWGYQKR